MPHGSCMLNSCAITSTLSMLLCAVERGRELRADYKLVARALTRKGNALAKQGLLEEAITVYQKSLTEHRLVRGSSLGALGGW